MTDRKLSWTEATELRAKYATGLYTQDQLAVRYDLSQPAVSQIVRDESYGAVWDVRVAPTRPERAIPPIPSTMSGAMPAQLPDEDVHAYVIRHNEPVAAYYQRLDARSDALDPDGRERYAVAVAAARARWQRMGLDAAREAA